jgi:A/G-specific adenine glycosylase
VVEKQHEVSFTQALMKWNEVENQREMPWKGIRDPYKIWLSEIILQQTRVEQGLDYYNRFIEHFPTVDDLAKADDDLVFKMWEGLGYYSRCRNLLATARKISQELNGQFPRDHKAILALKGVGPYTAAAIGSFAFGLPLAVVDGNVYRVLARYFGLKTPIDATAGKQLFSRIAEQLLDKQNPGGYNQAIMDLGAVICTPRNPACAVCPLRKTCSALQVQNWDELPVKSKKVVVRQRFLYYLILEHHGSRLIRKRTGNDIWQNLFEYVLKEVDEPVTEKELIDPSFWGLTDVRTWQHPLRFSGDLVHVLTHQRISSNCLYVKIDQKIELEGYSWMAADEWRKLSFPKLINRFLEIL